MVFRTLVKHGGKLTYPKLDARLPATTWESFKHHWSTLPIYLFTIGGGIVCAAYCVKLASYEDTTLNKQKPFKDTPPDTQIPLLSVANYKDLKSPKNRPEL